MSTGSSSSSPTSSLMTSSHPDYESLAMGLIGGLSLFLFGMQLLTDSMKLVLGDRFKVWLEKLTSNRLMGLILGAALTVACQSSGITTVLIVSLVSADILPFTSSIGVILGANLGSTMTGQLISFSITKYYAPIVAAGMILQSLPIRASSTNKLLQRLRSMSLFGNTLMGLGLVFLGMEVLSSGAKVLRTIPSFISALENLDNRVAAVLVGMGITAVIQSSGAMSAIVITLANQGLIRLELGCALMVGANVGSCAPSLLVALRQSRVAQQTALAHLCFNWILVAIWTPALPILIDFVKLFPPHVDEAEVGETAKREEEMPRQIANLHTFANLFIVILLLPFTNQFARAMQWLRPAKAPEKLSIEDREESLWSSNDPETETEGPTSGITDADVWQESQVPNHADVLVNMQSRTLPDLKPCYLNNSYLASSAGLSVELGWHVLVKETYRFTRRLTDAFKLVSQALLHTYLHAQLEMLEMQVRESYGNATARSNSVGITTAGNASSSRSNSHADRWNAIFSSHAGRQLSAFSVWARELWSYHAALRAYHSSLIGGFGLLTMKQTGQLIRWSSLLHSLETAVQTIHQLIATAHFIHPEEQQQLQEDDLKRKRISRGGGSSGTCRTIQTARTLPSDPTRPSSSMPMDPSSSSVANLTGSLSVPLATVVPPPLYELTNVVGKSWNCVGLLIARVVEEGAAKHKGQNKTQPMDVIVGPASTTVTILPVSNDSSNAQPNNGAAVSTPLAPTQSLVEQILALATEVSRLVRETSTMARLSRTNSSSTAVQPLPDTHPMFQPFPVRVARVLKALYFSSWQIAQQQLTMDYDSHEYDDADEGTDHNDLQPRSGAQEKVNPVGASEMEMQWVPTSVAAAADQKAADDLQSQSRLNIAMDAITPSIATSPDPSPPAASLSPDHISSPSLPDETSLNTNTNLSTHTQISTSSSPPDPSTLTLEQATPPSHQASLIDCATSSTAGDATNQTPDFATADTQHVTFHTE